MKKNLVLYILLAFLIVVNGFFLINHLGNSKNDRRVGPKSPDDFIVKELNFSDQQLEDFKQISSSHHEAMMTLSKEIRRLKDSLFNSLSNSSFNESSIDAITTVIGQKEKEKETKMFYHLQEIQNLCDDKQKEKFQNIVKNALHKGGPGPGPRGPNGDRRRPPPR